MYEYNDGLRSGGRRPRLYLAKGHQVVKFIGKNIPGFVAIATEEFEKNGKWSNTTYQLELVSGVRPIEFLSPLHGTWGDDLPSWGAVAEKLQLPIEVCQTIIREEYPRTAKRLDDLEQFTLENEKINLETEIVIISFGAPTRQQVVDGYWEKPKTAYTSDDRTVTVYPNPDWLNPAVIEPEGCKIINVKPSPGMRGGYYSIEVAVPIK